MGGNLVNSSNEFLIHSSTRIVLSSYFKNEKLIFLDSVNWIFLYNYVDLNLLITGVFKNYEIHLIEL